MVHARVVPDAGGAWRLRRRRDRADALGRRVPHAVRVRARVGRHSALRIERDTEARPSTCSDRAACSERCPARSVASSSSPPIAGRSASTSWSRVASICDPPSPRSTRCSRTLDLCDGPAQTAGRSRMSVSEKVVAAVEQRARRAGRAGAASCSARRLVGSALALNPWRFLLRPGTAYAALCGPDASCSSGWTVFCCSINAGRNSCPPGSIPAGWWKTDRSGFCNGGARYIIDCNATCGSCGCGGGGICAPGCYNCGCHCGSGSCDERLVCCNQFRYGQCHQELACVGPVVCRVASCRPPWEVDPTCTTASATANETALHTAPCLGDNATAFVSAFGTATELGAPTGQLRSRSSVSPRHRAAGATGSRVPTAASSRSATRASTAHRQRAAQAAHRRHRGDAERQGLLARRVRRRRLLVRRRAVPRLDGRACGSTNRSSAWRATPSGNGYWLVAADGGVFAFGDAHFYGSTGGIRLNQPIVGMAATPSGKGYWLVARTAASSRSATRDFSDPPASIRLAQPIVGMAATLTRQGLLARRRRRRHLRVRRRALLRQPRRTGGAKGRAFGMAADPAAATGWRRNDERSARATTAMQIAQWRST